MAPPDPLTISPAVHAALHSLGDLRLIRRTVDILDADATTTTSRPAPAPAPATAAAPANSATGIPFYERYYRGPDR